MDVFYIRMQAHKVQTKIADTHKRYPQAHIHLFDIFIYRRYGEFEQTKKYEEVFKKSFL